MAVVSETSFNSHTCSYQWTVKHLKTRLCHPGQLKSSEFSSPDGANPATKWRLVLFKERGKSRLRSFGSSANTNDFEEYVSVKLERVRVRVPGSNTETNGTQSNPDRIDVWVEARLKTPTRRLLSEIFASQSKGPVQVSLVCYRTGDAVTFNHCILTSSLCDTKHVTFECDIKVWALDNPVHTNVLPLPPQPSVQVPEFNLGKIMDENRRKNFFTDVTLVTADKKEFRAHKAILAAQSNFFKTRFSSRWQDQRSSGKVELADVPGNVMEVMLSYMYTGEVAAIEEVAISVLPFAEEYGLEGLRKMCEQSLAESLTSDNVVDLLITANAHNALDLKKVCMDYISSNVVSVRKSEGWRKLKEDKMCRDLWVEVLEEVAESHNHDGATTSSTNHSSDWTEVNQLPVPSFNTW